MFNTFGQRVSAADKLLRLRGAAPAGEDGAGDFPESIKLFKRPAIRIKTMP